MRRPLCLLALVVSLVASPTGRADEPVRFASLDRAATPLVARLFRVEGEGRRPALVFLHGCSGLVSDKGAVRARELAWAAMLNAQGFHVLMVDSFGPRHHGGMCSPDTFDDFIYQSRAFDAYAALRYLQAQDFVQADRIGAIGWSQGGGALLNTIRAGSIARPAQLPLGDFRAALAFYPASCSKPRQRGAWASPVPLQVLIGDSDVWTTAEPCRTLIESHDDATIADIHVYPGAYHDFDWPGMPVHAVAAFRTRAGVVPIEGTDEVARADAIERVRKYFANYLQAP